MLPLISHIRPNLFDAGLAHRKSPVAVLPMKVLQRRSIVADQPLRPTCFDLPYDVAKRHRSGEQEKQMDMIRLRIDLHRRASEITQHATEISMEIWTKVVRHHAFAVLRAEDEVHVNLGERLRHGDEKKPFLRSFRAPIKQTRHGFPATQGLRPGLNPRALQARHDLARSHHQRLTITRLQQSPGVLPPAHAQQTPPPPAPTEPKTQPRVPTLGHNHTPTTALQRSAGTPPSAHVQQTPPPPAPKEPWTQPRVPTLGHNHAPTTALQRSAGTPPSAHVHRRSRGLSPVVYFSLVARWGAWSSKRRERAFGLRGSVGIPRGRFGPTRRLEDQPPHPSPGSKGAKDIAQGAGRSPNPGSPRRAPTRLITAL